MLRLMLLRDADATLVTDAVQCVAGGGFQVEFAVNSDCGTLKNSRGKQINNGVVYWEESVRPRSV